MEEIRTTLNIQMTHGNPDDWYLTIQEGKSRLQVLRCPLTDEQVGKLLHTRPVEVEGVLYSSENHGMRFECEPYEVVLPSDSYLRWEEELDRIEKDLEALKPGWQLMRETFNQYRTRRVKDGEQIVYNFSIKRWVDDGQAVED